MAQAFDAVGDLQAASGVQRTSRHRVHRMQRLDQGVDVAGSLGGVQVLAAPRRLSVGTRERSDDEHEHLALQA